MSDTPKDQAEKRGVVDEDWTPRFCDKGEIEKFENEMEDIMSQIPQVEPGSGVRK